MNVLPLMTALVLGLAMILGGGTQQGFMGDVVVQAAACALFGVALWHVLARHRLVHIGKAGMAFLGLCLALVVVQLLPFSPGLRLASLGIPEAAGGNLVLSPSWWAPLSLTPQASRMAVISAIPPVAVFLAVWQCDTRSRVLLYRLVLCIGGVALFLGVMQILQGTGSRLRFFAVTNEADAVGFFANRNHYAGQLYVTLAFAGVWVSTATRDFLGRRRYLGPETMFLAAAIAFLLVLIAGLAMARSRAGVLIAMGVVMGIGLMAYADGRGRHEQRTRIRARAIIVVLVFAVLLAAQLSIHQLLGRFRADVADNLRWPLNIATFEAAFSALPFGTGLGSFVRVYGAIEEPARLLPEYVNRAHDDVAEILLETGLLGVGLGSLFLFWFLRRAHSIWRQEKAGSSPRGRLILLQRAATLAIGAMLLHAMVDFGLRTTALSTLFAFACGLLFPPPSAGFPRVSRAKRRPAPAGRVSAAHGPVPPAWDGAKIGR